MVRERSEFYRGAVARLNYGLSVGGTQDNGTLKGGNPPQWLGGNGGDDATVVIDPRNSNVAFYTDIGGKDVRRTLNGGPEEEHIWTGLPTPVELRYQSLTMHPNDSNTLAVYSVTSKQVFRTTNALATQPSWADITTNTPLPGDILADLHALTISPSGIYFGGACELLDDNERGIWRMVTLGTWEQKGKLSLPAACIETIAVDTSQNCTSTSCNLYLGLKNFSVPGNVFRSCDAGQTWTNISGTGSTGLPVLPAYRVVIHPTNPNVIYVATDMGVFQGTFSGNIATCPQVGTWTWGTFTNGMPPTARVFDLVAHPDPVLLRAWTHGRGMWETQLANPNPDFKINTTQAPVTGTLHNSVRISSGTAVGTGNRFGVAWADDRGPGHRRPERSRMTSGSTLPRAQDSPSTPVWPVRP